MLKLKKIYFWVLVLFLPSCLLHFMGCATVPQREVLPAYNINGTNYFPLIALCNSRSIDWQYDTFARTVALSREGHKINLMVGENLVLVDGEPLHMRYPIDIYQGAIVAPYKFKEQVLDTLFKEAVPGRKIVSPLSKIRSVVIDPGHGGNDPGAIGRSGLREKDVNLDIAKRLSRLLRNEGIEVLMTRSTDKFIPLDRRVEIANNSGADLFISVHANANRVRSLSGLEIYYVAPSVSDSKRAYTAARYATLNLGNAYFASDSLDLKATVWDMIYTFNRAESINLSRSICNVMENNQDVQVLGIKGGRFEVLRGVRMPAVLIETGFLSNSKEERMLKNSYYRQKISEGILQGLEEYAKEATLTELASR